MARATGSGAITLTPGFLTILPLERLPGRGTITVGSSTALQTLKLGTGTGGNLLYFWQWNQHDQCTEIKCFGRGIYGCIEESHIHAAEFRGDRILATYLWNTFAIKFGRFNHNEWKYIDHGHRDNNIGRIAYWLVRGNGHRGNS